MTRPFNQEAYNQCDMPAKMMLKLIVEKNSDYRLVDDINEEHYKLCDLAFSNNKNVILYENEVRENFDLIVTKFDSVHIPIRKQTTKCNFYLVWKPDLSEFILIDRKTLDKYISNIVETIYGNDSRVEYLYNDKFIDIPKNETKYYVINPDYKPIYVGYDE